MSLIHHVTCGDLAALGGRWDALHQHDPRHQDAQLEAVCHCYMQKPPTSRDAECRNILRIPAGRDHLLVLCCLCQTPYRDATRDIRDEALDLWLEAQAEEALRYRDQRRFDSSPVAADLDLETAALEAHHA